MDVIGVLGLVLGILGVGFSIQQYVTGRLRDAKASGDAAEKALLTILCISEGRSDQDIGLARVITKLESITHVAKQALNKSSTLHEHSVGPRVIPSAEMLRYEQSDEVTSVFLFSPDLTPDINLETTREAVYHNLDRGTKYCYIYSVVHVSEIALKDFARRFALSKPGRAALVEFIGVSPEEFPGGLSNNVAIYDGKNRQDRSRCFAEVPYTRHESRRTWIELSVEDSLKLRSFLDDIRRNRESLFWHEATQCLSPVYPLVLRDAPSHVQREGAPTVASSSLIEEIHAVRDECDS